MSHWDGMQMLEAYLLRAICHIRAFIVHQSHLLTQEDLQEVAAGPMLEILEHRSVERNDSSRQSLGRAQYRKSRISDQSR
jgi:hypothetical protein